MFLTAAQLGFTIYVVPEAATLLFTGGARYDPSSIHTELGFEANKIRVQIALEDAFMELAKQQKRPTVIIWYVLAGRHTRVCSRVRGQRPRHHGFARVCRQ